MLRLTSSHFIQLLILKFKKKCNKIANYRVKKIFSNKKLMQIIIIKSR